MLDIKDQKKRARALVLILELFALAILIYLVFLPFYPGIKYYFKSKNEKIDYKDINAVKEIIEKEISAGSTAPGNGFENNILPLAGNNEPSDEAIDNNEIANQDIADENSGENNQTASQAQDAKKSASLEPVKIANTLMIPKIGVKIPIIESEDENYGLNRGAWKLPKSSAPDSGGNMILTGHRFKYLPPSNLTFYLFHKLETGDIASVIWNGKTYYYKIKEIKIVPSDDVSILEQTKTPTLTMYTCDPIYSIKNRLVVIADLML